MMGWMGGGAGLPFFLSCQNDPVTVPGRTWEHEGFPAPADHAPDPLTDRVFPMSVCSGDPSETGVILWTRIDPAMCDGLTDLTFQVSQDPGFATPLVEGRIPAGLISATSDHTVKVDLDGLLRPLSTYYYRLIYGRVPSRTGRCRTLPAAGEPLSSLQLAVFSCQDYTNGYYSAFRHVSRQNHIDFVLHLGDFIYESTGDARFQNHPFPDRLIRLPSEHTVAMDLDDYRNLYKWYRRDPDLLRAMEAHTWIMVPDDHETANDCYWDYTDDAPGFPDHPLHKEGDDARHALMRQSRQAWAEYVPTRQKFDPSTNRAADVLKIYRQFSFGDLADLFMLDTRTYRSPHACGVTDVFGRYLPLGCTAYKDEGSTMLGDKQRQWLLEGLYRSTTRWPVLGNQTWMSQLGLTLDRQNWLPVNIDAWDGYQTERRLLAGFAREYGMEDLVVLTGDMHTFMAGLLQVGYGSGPEAGQVIGVELMTSSVTSQGLIDTVRDTLLRRGEGRLLSMLSSQLIRRQNPHIRLFDPRNHGYATVRFTEDQLHWTALGFDKADPRAGAVVLRTLRKRRQVPELERVRI